MAEFAMALAQAIAIVVGVLGLWTLVCWIILTILAKLDMLSLGTAFFFCGVAFLIGALTILIYFGRS